MVKNVSKTDLVGAYVSNVFGNAPVLVFFNGLHVPTTTILEYISEMSGVNLVHSDLDDYVFITFENVKDTIYACNKIPKGMPYCQVWHNKELIHSN